MNKVDRFFKDAGSWFIEQDALLCKLDNEIRATVNKQISRALAFGVLVGFVIATFLK